MTGPKEKLLHPPTDLPRLARMGAELASSAGAFCALIGGAAMHAYGHIRATKDVDFAVTKEGCSAIEAALHARGERMAPLRIGGVSWSCSEGVIDFIDRRFGPGSLFEEALAEAGRLKASVIADGSPVAVVSLEHLVALKMVGARPQDDADLDHLLRHAELDYESARDIVFRHLGEIVARYLDRAARLAGRLDVPRGYEDDES